MPPTHVADIMSASRARAPIKPGVEHSVQKMLEETALKAKIIIVALPLLICLGSNAARAQESPATMAGGAANGQRQSEARVPLAETAIALDAAGREALAGRLRTTQLAGTPEAPERNSRLVVENRSAIFYTYVTGWATFYDATGVRCGEGLWKLEALAPNESAEVDTPGLRLTCAPASWRIVAANLITRTTSDAAKPADMQTPPPPTPEAAIPQPTASVAPVNSSPATALPPLEININGKTLPIQPGNPLEITVGKERVRITLNAAP